MKENANYIIPETSEKIITTEREYEINVYGGTSNYNDLTNKPQINNVELVGNKTLEELGIKQIYTANDIAFSDGETFQQKYDSGELKGEKGDRGETGPAAAWPGGGGACRRSRPAGSPRCWPADSAANVNSVSDADGNVNRIR